jgi:hypothetical protein
MTHQQREREREYITHTIFWFSSFLERQTEIKTGKRKNNTGNEKKVPSHIFSFQKFRN